MSLQFLQPSGWPRPKGYSNGIAASGQMIFVAGQIGWDANCQWQTDDLAEQVRQTLVNTLAVLKAGGAGPEHVTRMTWYITDKADYLRQAARIGEIYRELMGKHYPAMAMVVVTALMEDRAKVEIETTAVV
ncbi:MAG: enamine deaminase RidA [Opitutus sp.]|nr:enamine deaminase RidA [Opitutus sp.]